MLLESIEVGPGEAPGVGAHGVKLRHNWTQWGGDHTMKVGGMEVGVSGGETTFHQHILYELPLISSETMHRKSSQGFMHFN